MSKFVFFGTSDFAVPSLQELLKTSHECVAVITSPDKKVGRKQILTPSAVSREAEKHGLRVFTPAKLKEFYEEYKTLAPDFGVVVSYGKIIPQNFIDLPPFGIINVHASLLPRHRGAAPIQATILEGDAKTGVTIMKIDAGIDTGPTLAAKEVPLLQTETSEELFEMLAPLGAELLVVTLDTYLSGTLSAKPQSETGATYASMIKKEDGHIDFTNPAETLERKVRAYTPWPGTYALLSGKQVKIHKVRVASSLKNVPEAGILFSENDSLFVATHNGALEVLEIQLEGKKRISGSDFLKGHANLLKQKLS